MTREVYHKQVADDIRRLVRSRGWCFVECSALGGEIIAIVRDVPPLLKLDEEKLAKSIEAIKESRSRQTFVARYTIPEFLMLSSSPSFQLVHEVKKLGGEIEVSSEAGEGVL